MPLHEPISVFRKPEPANFLKRLWSNPVVQMRIACGCLACSTASLLAVIAADIAINVL
jgi:hypothetical protein